MTRRLGRVGADLLGAVVLWIPGRVGSELRVAFYRLLGANIGKRTRLEVGCTIDSPRRVRIGDDCWIDRFAILIAGTPRPGRETREVGSDATIAPGTIQIGARCHVGPHAILSGIGGLRLGDGVTLSAGCKLYSLSHHYRSWSRPADRSVVFGSMAPPENQSMLEGPIRIDDNVGLGADVLVLPGSCIGADSFVRPRSLVTGAWPENSLLAGDPVHREGPRFSAP